MDMHTVMASTVHDVKNSLGMINNQLADLVKRLKTSDPDSARELLRIQLECGRINNGMVHMLGLYKLNQGMFSPKVEEVYVPDVIMDVTSRYREMLDAMGVALSVNIDDDLLWYMDSNLVEGLLTNVLTNSIRYSKSLLSFDIQEVDGWLNIRIRDDGDGFPEKMLTMLDEAETVCFESGATGLGLYFCQQIAQMHTAGERKGYVQLSNEASGGAVFDLFLP
jgi:K+-sensing histidine kinase KdpD